MRGRPTGTDVQAGTTSWRAFAWAVLAAAGAVGVFYAVLLAKPGGPEVTRAIDDVGRVLGAAFAGLVCRWRALRHTGRERRAWFLLGASAAAWAIGQTVWSYYEL